MLDVGTGGIAASMKAIRSLGAEGHFAISESGGEALIQAFREMGTWVDNNLVQLNLIAQEPPLGSSHGATTIKPYVQQVATDQQGFITMLKEFRKALRDAELGVQDAMRNYEQIDSAKASTFRANG
jgi:hypothetical protein